MSGSCVHDAALPAVSTQEARGPPSNPPIPSGTGSGDVLRCLYAGRDEGETLELDDSVDGSVAGFVKINTVYLQKILALLLQIDPVALTVSEDIESIFWSDNVPSQAEQSIAVRNLGDDVDPFEIEGFFEVGPPTGASSEYLRGHPLRLEAKNGSGLFLSCGSFHGPATIAAAADTHVESDLV